MNAELRPDQAGRRLSGWKEIAAFFGCDERTVKRWESDRGLPVKRLPNGPRSGVFAYESELRAWLDGEGKSEPTSPQSIGGVSRSAVTWRRPRILVVALAGAISFVTLAAVWFGLKSERLLETRVTTAENVPNETARTFYRAGLYAWQTRTPVGLTRAVDDFTQAIVHDPQYAEAYAGLASCYNLLREYTTMAPEYAFPRAKAAAERAIALNPSLADAHASLAFVDFYWLRDVASARHEFERAIALAPNNATAHHWYATFLMTIGEFPRAMSEIDKAENLDTESTAIRADKGFILFYAGRTDEAVSLLRQLEQTEPLFASPHHYLSVIYRARGDDAGFLRELAASADARADEAGRTLAEAGTTAFANGGHKAMLLAVLMNENRLHAEHKVSAFAVAETYADLGDAGNALALIRESVERRELDNVTLAIEPVFRSLRNNPQFRKLASEVFRVS